MPGLKANAYGHGALPVARELNCLGVRAFCVATVGEGMELRQGGVEGLILVWDIRRRRISRFSRPGI